MAVTIRKLDLNDAGDVMDWLSDEKAARFCCWEPYTDKSDKSVVIDYIQNHVGPHPWFRAICVDGRAVGAISVTENAAARDRCRGEMGYVLGSKFWGRGIGTAAVKLAAEMVFVERPELKRVEALVEVENLASMRVLEKVGFWREGVLRKYREMRGELGILLCLVFFPLILNSMLIKLKVLLLELWCFFFIFYRFCKFYFSGCHCCCMVCSFSYQNGYRMESK